MEAAISARDQLGGRQTRVFTPRPKHITVKSKRADKYIGIGIYRENPGRRALSSG